jgi:hypothetical protein
VSPPAQETLELLLAVLLKIADISNIARPFRLARLWGERLHAEWLQQGDLETDQGLPVLDFMDRVKQPSLPLGQAGFIRGCGVPFLAELAAVFPAFHERYAVAVANRDRWLALAETTEWDDERGGLVALPHAMDDALVMELLGDGC